MDFYAILQKVYYVQYTKRYRGKIHRRLDRGIYAIANHFSVTETDFSGCLFRSRRV